MESRGLVWCSASKPRQLHLALFLHPWWGHGLSEDTSRTSIKFIAAEHARAIPVLEDARISWIPNSSGPQNLCVLSMNQSSIGHGCSRHRAEVARNLTHYNDRKATGEFYYPIVFLPPTFGFISKIHVSRAGWHVPPKAMHPPSPLSDILHGRFCNPISTYTFPYFHGHSKRPAVSLIVPTSTSCELGLAFQACDAWAGSAVSKTRWGRGQVFPAETQCSAPRCSHWQKDTKPRAGAAGRQTMESNRSFPEQQVEQLEGYVHVEGRKCLEVVGWWCKRCKVSLHWSSV